MTSILGYLSLLLGLGALVLGAATWIVSDRFFNGLIRAQPQASSDFPKVTIAIPGMAGGPISSARQNYLKARRYEALDDPDLRQLGRCARVLLVSYAIVFTAMLISLLLWVHFRIDTP